MLIFSKGERVPVLVDIAGVRQGVSELLQAIYTNPQDICCGFAAVLTLNFGFPNSGEREPLWGWAFVVSDGASVTSYRSHYKTLRCLLSGPDLRGGPRGPGPQAPHQQRAPHQTLHIILV